MKIICITPLKHQKGLYEIMKNYGEVDYKPEISKVYLSKYLKKNLNINCIFCNPNKQNYILDKSVLKNSGIKIINTGTTGLNHINLKDCDKLGIKIISLTKDFKLLKNLPSTSELAFTLMLSLLKKISLSSNSVKNNRWDYEPFVGNEISSLSIGIIGFGRLGKIMSKFCHAFGMQVYVYDPYVKSKKYNNSTMSEIAKKCDVISIHVHVKKDTIKMIDKVFLKKLVKKPIIINTSRGEILSEKDIIYALKDNSLRGYGTDVIEDEYGNISKSPIVKGIKMKLNILATPHIGGMTWQGQKRAWIWSINKFKFIKKFLDEELSDNDLVKLHNKYRKKQKIYE